MALNLSHKLIKDHLVDGEMTPGEPIALKIDQTLTQDATGTLVMLELEALGLDRAKTELSAQYVDHNLIQADYRNPDDHVFLHSACRRFGIWFSGAGNGVSHPVHMQRFGKPGKTLAGSDSHTCAAGSLGMLAIGSGGLDVAMAIAGDPLHIRMPKVRGIRLTGELPEWVSAKDVILEVLRRLDVDGGSGCILEYYGPGLDGLTAMDRHVIANMGMETGATTSVFPSDDATRAFLKAQGREDDWSELAADEAADYDLHDEIDLSRLEPLIAKPSSPGKVVPVREVAGEDLYQAYIGSSANPGFRDFAVPAMMVKQRPVDRDVSFDVNPTSRQLLEDLIAESHLASLVHGGARLHQAGCNGCIGMGQAPASGRNSLRTVPRNFPGRSGVSEDSVFLCSPETATASAIAGEITDPRDLGLDYPRVEEPEEPHVNDAMLEAPLAPEEAKKVELVKGPNVVTLPEFEALPERLELTVLLALNDDVSTDEIMPAGANVLPYRSNVPGIAEFCFRPIDERYADRAKRAQKSGDGHAIAAGENYGQGSSREHAAIAPRHLGLRMVVAKSFARIHWQNLVNYGVLPVQFEEAEAKLKEGDTLVVENLHQQLRQGDGKLSAEVDGKRELKLVHDLSDYRIAVLLAGGLINWKREQG